MPVVITENTKEALEANIEVCQHPNASECVLRIIRENIESTENSICVANLGSVVGQMSRWKQLLPRVRPFYAMKCNPDPRVVQLLASMGAGFDCASRTEIQLALHHVTGCNIVYANPFKFKKDILYGRRHDVRWSTFDSEGELLKLASVWPDAELVLRVLPRKSYRAQCELNDKFGAAASEVEPLLIQAKELGMRIVGVSFHVGSGCDEQNSWAEMVGYSRQIFDLALDLGHKPYLLDIGGGFPGVAGLGPPTMPDQFEAICGPLRSALDACFPSDGGYTLIAEPGRFFVAGAFTLATQVIGKHDLDLNDQIDACISENHMTCSTSDESLADTPAEGENGASAIDTDDDASSCSSECDVQASATRRRAIRYVVNDGIYGTFNNVVFDHAHPRPLCVVRSEEGESEDACFPSKVYGPTCDSFDCILQLVDLPELSMGDWLVWPEMGAYTLAAGSTFNGIPRPDVTYFVCVDATKEMRRLCLAARNHRDGLQMPNEDLFLVA